MTYRLRNILIAIGLAAVAALLTVYYVGNVKKDVKQGDDLVSIYVAAKDIPAGTAGSEVVKGGMLEAKEVARRSIVPGAISNPEQIDDLVSSETIYAGEQVTARRFQPVEQQGIVAEISGNVRAIQVPGDQHQLLAGTLRKGDRVDVVASIKFRTRDIQRETGEDRASATAGVESERVASRVVLRDLLVLRAAEKPTLDGGLVTPTGNTSVVLAVTDSQAQKLFFVLKNGDWSLQLRPADDSVDSPESVETVETVLGDGLKDSQLAQLIYGFGKGSY